MTQITPTDEELVRQLRSGSREALGAIYTRYKDHLCNYCYCIIKDKDRAEDAVHELFVKVWENIDSLNDPGSFRSWLFSIARNEALLFVRDRKYLDPLSEQTLVENEDPLELVVKNEQSARFGELLDALNPGQRELIVLRMYDQLSYAEIGTVTGLSSASVRVHLFRARKNLAKLYTKHYGEEK